MGRLIAADAVKKKYPLMENDFGMTFNEGLHKAIDSMPTVEAIPKADYEARLKADIAERMEKFQKKIKELDLTDVFPDYQRGATDTRDYISYMLQKEIDSIKGGK